MHVGERIRQAREARGFSIGTIARVTRIPPAALAAIDRNDIAALPPHPYNKGFLEAYAREIGLDPHQTAREFLDQFRAISEPVVADRDQLPPQVVIEGRPRPAIWLAVPLVGLLMFLLATREPAVEAPSASREATPSAEADAAPAVQPGSAAAEGAPAGGLTTAASAAHTQAISVALLATGPAWVEAHADGRRVLYELLEPGAGPHLSADRELMLRIGDAGAISLTVNNRAIGILGTAGEVRDLRITPENAGTIR